MMHLNKTSASKRLAKHILTRDRAEGGAEEVLANPLTFLQK